MKAFMYYRSTHRKMARRTELQSTRPSSSASCGSCGSWCRASSAWRYDIDPSQSSGCVATDSRGQHSYWMSGFVMVNHQSGGDQRAVITPLLLLCCPLTQLLHALWSSSFPSPLDMDWAKGRKIYVVMSGSSSDSLTLSSLQTGFLAFIAAMLVARTYCDVWMIQNGTMIERSESWFCISKYPTWMYVNGDKGGWSSRT